MLIYCGNNICKSSCLTRTGTSMFFSTDSTTHASLHVSVISSLLLNLMYIFPLLGKENID